jgi:ABC-type Fe3+ transport system permease subunit
MIPEVPVHQASRPLTTAPLSALLILPVPRAERKRSIWMSFLRDLSFLLPAFGTALGYLLLAGQAPFTGAVLITACPVMLLIRLYMVYTARRERRQMAAMEKWYRDYRNEMESQWRSRYKAGCA